MGACSAPSTRRACDRTLWPSCSSAASRSPPTRSIAPGRVSPADASVLAGLFGAGSVASLVLAGWSLLRARGAVRGRVDRFVVAGGLPEPVVAAARSRRGRARVGGRVTGNLVTRRLELELSRARVDLTPNELLIASGVLAAAGLTAASAATGQLTMGLLGVLVGGALPLVWVRRRYGRVLSEFQQQLPATLESVVASVRAGNDLTSALARVAAEAPEPTRSAMTRAVRGIDLGMGVEEALGELAERYRSDDLELVVSAIAIERTVGGNLPKVLELLSETTRQRVVLRREVRSLTAQQRYSAWLLALLPVVAFSGMYLISRDYVSPLLEGTGRVALIVAAALIALALVVMRRLGDVDL